MSRASLSGTGVLPRSYRESPYDPVNARDKGNARAHSDGEGVQEEKGREGVEAGLKPDFRGFVYRALNLTPTQANNFGYTHPIE